ncbi:MAG: uridine-cytidine kinase [Ferruginibacter sp.]|nr:uridine-cytidine kinase [Cytophagales bacterium]
MAHPYIVGITGGSASGKTFFLESLLGRFSEGEICLIPQDNYYYPLHQQTRDENGVVNFDLPESIDFRLYAQHIVDLRSSRTVTMREYTFNNPHAFSRTLVFQPSPIVVVEGIFVFHFPEIANLLDLKVFIDAKEHIKLRRRIVRDQSERNLTLEEVLYQYERHVMPTYEKYISPHKADADIIIANNRHFEKGLDVLTAFLKTKVPMTEKEPEEKTETGERKIGD